MPYTETQRMELRSHVNLAGEVIARLWPMRTFISRNPLQGLEELSFDAAVTRGEQLFGGKGYLTEEAFRDAFRRGRIHIGNVDAVLQPLVSDKAILFGDRRVSQLDVLRASMVEGLRLPDPSGGGPSSTVAAELGEDPAVVEAIAQWIMQVLSSGSWAEMECPLPCDPSDWPYQETMATWCDRTLGTDLTGWIDRQMITWCAAFCDEGEATWVMPNREDTFFRAWKAAAQYDLGLRWCGIEGASRKIQRLSDRPEEALLESLERLTVPKPAWQDYLALHLAALPGWTGFIKWRAEQTADPWQEAYRIDLVKYLAVRLFYERELVATTCRESLACMGAVEAVQEYARQFPHALWFRRSLVKGHLTKQAQADAARLRRRRRSADAQAWEELGRRWYHEWQQVRQQDSLTAWAHLLVRLAKAVGIRPDLIPSTTSGDLTTLFIWLRGFSERLRGRKWLEAYELAHQREVIGKLESLVSAYLPLPEPGRPSVRPTAQFVFCIDVRSEVFRRHLEQRGGYETYGFAGFFGLPVSYRPLNEPYECELCPVLLKPKHLVREVPRTYQVERVQRHKTRAKLAKAGHDLFHDLKHNVITPYVMVEAIGWFFMLPFLGKTLCPRWYHRVTAWLRQELIPPVATTLTVDKLEAKEAEDMVATEQRLQIARWLREHGYVAGGGMTAEVLERVRQQALEFDRGESEAGALGRLFAFTTTQEAGLIEELRRDCRLTPPWTRARLDRITQTGFTLNEQAYYVETSLRLMGLTGSFARLVVLCGHGSTSQNNPYESALDCGACGGSHGLPNARTFALLANRPRVREVLARRGITIPPDTYFVPALHDTTTDRLRIADLEDVPATHRKELAHILEDVQEAGMAAAAERWAALSGSSTPSDPRVSVRDVEQRSLDWAQVRPEWGLARNSLFIIGSRALTQGADLGGRSFLHSYDHASDQDGKLLEFIMTAPLIVAQWINMEYYFSTTDPDVYGSGSKVYHNVTARIGVMTGYQGDLRMGLPVQTVLNAGRPYHEPMRLTALIEAPRERIQAIIRRQPLLERLFNNGWMLLLACEPSGQRFYRYESPGTWRPAAEIG